MQCKIYCQHQIIHKFYLSIGCDRISVCQRNDRFHNQNHHFHNQHRHFHNQNHHFHNQNHHFHNQHRHFHNQNDHFRNQHRHFHNQSDRFGRNKVVIQKCDVYDGLHATFTAVFYPRNKKGKSMQAYKLNATIDESGHLIIDEPLNIAPGKVEVIILQPVSSLETSTETPTESQPEKPRRKSKVKAFEGLFENAPPTPPDFDPDQARWEYLKEKHNL
ncbi:hypothetical protein [Nostoc sp.]